MSPSQFSQENEEYDTDIVTLVDDNGRSLDCYIENFLEKNGCTYLLLQPMDFPVMILSWDETGDHEDEVEADTIILEEEEEIALVFPDAKAVLAELDLTLKHTAFTLTASGSLPPIEEEDIISLDVDDQEDNEEELQWLASFYSQDQKYHVCTPLTPLLFVAKDNLAKGLELLTPEDPQLSPILEELLYDELE